MSMKEKGKQTSQQNKGGKRLSGERRREMNPRRDKGHKLEQKKKEERKESDSPSEIFSKHLVLQVVRYENFSHKIHQFLDNFEFSWSVHGVDMLSKFLPVTTQVVIQEMSFAFQMTNRSFANKKQRLDTSDFRNAIVFYLKEIHGIRDETFKYKKINDLFSIDQKKYIKKVMCAPQTVTGDDFSKFSELLYDSEKCHVCILAMETKKQVSLTYLGKALSDLMT